MGISETTWRRYAPSGPEWAPPKSRRGSNQKMAARDQVQGRLLAIAVGLYWRRRPDPRTVNHSTRPI